MPTSDNPAGELYALLKEWQYTPPNEHMLTHRATSAGAEADQWWSVHLRAAHLLDLVQDQLVARAAAASTDAATIGALATFTRLQRAIFGTDDVLNGATSTNRLHISDEDLALLQTLSWIPPATRVLDAEALTSLLAAAKLATSLVQGSTQLDEESKHYLLDVATHLERAISLVSSFGGDEVRRLAAELSGALAAYFVDAPDEEREAASGIITKILQGIRRFFVSDVGQAALKTAASEGTKMLMS